MTNNRDDFSKPVADALAKRAAYICSNPECHALTLAPSPADESKFLYIGKAAHICAASPGGPRYDSSMSPDVRKGPSNGIFLCSNCAEMIDKNQGVDFSVAVLQEWKAVHEKWATANINKRQSGGHSANVFNVTSIRQQGGITAGVVNIGPQARILDSGAKSQLLGLVPDKSRTVTIFAILGDDEAFGFATQIKDYLISCGYNINGVNRAVFGQVVSPIHFEPSDYQFSVGNNK